MGSPESWEGGSYKSWKKKKKKDGVLGEVSCALGPFGVKKVILG